MKLTLGELRQLIREATDDCWGGSRPEEMYEEELMDDPALAKRSTYVPNDIKRSIRSWAKKMGLSGHRRAHRT